MPYYPESGRYNMPTIHSFSKEAIGDYTRAYDTSTASNLSYESANLAIFVPLTLKAPFSMVKMFCYNGTSPTGNVDVGIYDYGFNLLISAGSTARSGDSVLQEFNLTDTIFYPGKYWMAIACSATSNFFQKGLVADEITLSGTPVYVAATSMPLPTGPVTVTKPTASSPKIPIFGMTQLSTI